MKEQKYSIWLLLFLSMFLCANRLDGSVLSGLRVFSEKDYLRLAFSLDEAAKSTVELNPQGNLIFVRFENTGISSLLKQSYLYENNPHLESVTFLPVGEGATVVRVKARHAFKIRTYNIHDPAGFVLELHDFTSVPAGDNPEKRDPRTDYYNQGLGQMRNGQNNAALMSFHSAIKAGTQVPESFFQAGVIRYKMGQYNFARINFTRALASSAYGDHAQLYLCSVYYKTRNLPALRESWKKLLDRVPEPSSRLRLAGFHPDIDYPALASAAGEIGLTESLPAAAVLPGRPELAEVDSGAPGITLARIDSASIYYEQGMALKKQGQTDKAAAAFESAVACDGNYADAYFQLALAYKSLGREKEAAQTFEKLLRLGTGSASPVGENIGSAPSGSARLDSESPALADGNPDAGEKSLTVLPADNSGNSGVPSAQAALDTESRAAAAPDRAESSAEPAHGSFRVFGAVREAVFSMMTVPQRDLLRKRVLILTLLMGLIFGFTVLAKRIALRGAGSLWVFPDRGGHKAGKIRGPIILPSADKSAARTIRKNKHEVAQVLARQLAMRQKAGSENVADLKNSGGSLFSRGELELKFRPVAEKGVYGADIARRIKDVLSGKHMAGDGSLRGAAFGNGNNEHQTRLIRQLRKKNWSVSDIAQEMNLSREEVRWALEGGSAAEQDLVLAHEAAGGRNGSDLGQARSLLLRREPQKSAALGDNIDREVDLELQINV